MIRVLVFFQSLFWIQGVAGTNEVSQANLLWVKYGQSATINCSHTKGADYNRMYWFRQYHAESMELIVYSPTYGTPDFGKFNQSKYSVMKAVPERGSFTLNNVDYDDSAVYFCAAVYWIKGVVGKNEVSQPSLLWVIMGQSATINCSHTKGASYDRMYWFRQYHAESMELIVYSPTYGTPDFGKFNQSKYSVMKAVPERGSFTLNNVDYDDGAVYFCAAYYTVL